MNLIKTTIRKAKSRSSFLNGVLTLASGSAASQALAVIASPLLTRLYTPDHFGALALFVALLGIISVVSCLRYELAIPMAKTRTAALNVVAIAIGFNLLIALAIAATVFPLRSEVSKALPSQTLADYLWLLPVGVFLVGLYNTLTFWAVREKSFRPLARTKLIQAIGGIGTQLAFGASNPSPLGLILGQLVGQSAGALTLSRNMLLKAFSLKYRFRHRRLVAAAKRYIRFPKYDLPAAGLNTIAANLPQFMLAVLFNPAVAGSYLLAHRVISMPVSVLGQAVGQGLYANSREAISAGTLERFVSKVAATLLLTIAPPFVILLTFGEELFAAVFGSEWRTAGTYASWLIFGAAAQFIYAPISFVLQATNAQHINLALQTFMLISRCSALFVGFYTSEALTAIIALAIADTIHYTFGTFLTLRQIRKHTKRRPPSK